MKDTVSKTKHWRFEYSHKLESSLQRRIKHADELYLRTIERLDYELELLKKFKYAMEMDTVRVKHLSNTPRFASRRYMEEARQTAQAAPSKHNLARLEAYNFKLGNRYVDLANYTRVDTEKQADELEKMLYESATGAPHHQHRHKNTSAAEQNLQDLLRHMIAESQAKTTEKEQREKLTKISSARKGGQKGPSGGERQAVIRISKAHDQFL